MYFAGMSWRNLHPVFIAGLILVSVGAATVLIFQPRAKPHAGKPEVEKTTPATDSEPAAKTSSLAEVDKAT